MKKRQRGNALLEYVVPMALLILAAGFVSTVVDIKGILAEYFMSGSGYTSSALSGGTFKTDAMPKPAVSTPGNGSENMTSVASVTNGGGASAASSGVGFLGNGAWSRSGARQAPASTEVLF